MIDESEVQAMIGQAKDFQTTLNNGYEANPTEYHFFDPALSDTSPVIMEERYWGFSHDKFGRVVRWSQCAQMFIVVNPFYYRWEDK